MRTTATRAELEQARQEFRSAETEAAATRYRAMRAELRGDRRLRTRSRASTLRALGIDERGVEYAR